MILARRCSAALADLDGFYTFVVGTENGFIVLATRCLQAGRRGRDGRLRRLRLGIPRARDLPGIADANVWEPEPANRLFLGAQLIGMRTVDLAASSLREL